MALIKCPECGQDVSTSAAICPHCGFPQSANPAFETKVVQVRCFGRGTNAVEEQVKEEIDKGWEIASIVEDPRQGRYLFPAYIVTLRRLVKCSVCGGVKPIAGVIGGKRYCNDCVKTAHLPLEPCEFCGKQAVLFDCTIVDDYGVRYRKLCKACREKNHATSE